MGPGLGVENPGAVEVPDDDQNDAGRGDVGQDAAVPAQDVQCGGLMYVVAVKSTSPGSENHDKMAT